MATQTAWIQEDPCRTLTRVTGRYISSRGPTARRISLWVITLGAMATITCGEVTSYAFTEDAETFVRGTSSEEPLDGNLDFGGFEALNLPDDEQLTQYGASTNQFNRIDVSSLMLTIADLTPGDDLSFLSDVTFYAEAPGLERMKIARGQEFLAGQPMANLVPEDVDLRAHALTRAMRITNDFQGVRPPRHMTLKATLTLEVHVQLKEAVCGGHE